MKFEAIRNVAPERGKKVRPGETGDAPREVVEKWLEVGAVKLVMPSERQSNSGKKRPKDADDADGRSGVYTRNDLGS